MPTPNDEFIEVLKTLEDKLHWMKTTNAKLAEQCATVVAKADQLEEENKRLTGELAGKAVLLGQSRRDHDDLKASLAVISRDLHEAKMDIRDLLSLREKNQHLTGAVEYERKQRLETHQENESLKKEVARLTEEATRVITCPKCGETL
jgi:FtsZ-binding cell division protein ZapB